MFEAVNLDRTIAQHLLSSRKSQTLHDLREKIRLYGFSPQEDRK